MRTKIMRTSKRTISMVLSVLMVVSCLLVGTVTTVNAGTIDFYDNGGDTNCYIYYDDSSANISNNNSRDVYFLIGNTGTGQAYKMDQVSNTSLYRRNFTSNWIGATGIGFGSKDSAPTGSTISAIKTNCTAYTTLYEPDEYKFYGKRTYFFYGSSDTNKTLNGPSQVGGDTAGDQYSNIKNKVTLKTKRKTVGASSYSDYSTNLATMNITSRYWTGSTTTNESTTPDTDFQNGSVSYDSSVAGASTTFSYKNLTAGYELVGWYDSSGTQLSTSPSYNLNQTGHKSNITYYGYFSQQYNVTVSSDGNGTVTVGGSGTSKYVSQGSSVAIAATPATDYAFEYWEVTGGTINETASNLSAADAVTPTGTTQNITLTAHFKKTKFSITVAASPVAGGSVSPASFSNVTVNDTNTITATPDTEDDYMFAGWSAVPAENIHFDNPASDSTTFTASGDAVITANFTQDHLYDVDVSLDGTTTHTYRVGTVITPTLTAATPEDDEYSFDYWIVTGDVTITSGSTTTSTITISATGEGTVTAHFKHINYIYFYGAIQATWDKVPVVLLDEETVPVYKWIAQYGVDNPLTLYNGSGTAIGSDAENGKKYYIGAYRVDASTVTNNSKIHVWGSNSWQSSTAIAFNSGANGYCYYVYSSSYGVNTHGSLAPAAVTEVSFGKASGHEFDADDTITIGRTVSPTYNSKTAGQDTYTYTYTLINASTSAEVMVLEDDVSVSTNQISFTALSKEIPAGNYKVRITLKDAKTAGKMGCICDSASFSIRDVPSTATVTFTQTNSGAHSSFTGSYTYKGSNAASITSGVTEMRAGSEVILTLTLNAGFTQGDTTLTGISSVNKTYDSSTRVLTFTFTVPLNVSEITVSHEAAEVTRNDIKVTNNVDNKSTAYTGVGVKTEANIPAPAVKDDYTFVSWTIPEGLTQTQGNASTNGPIKVKVKDTYIYHADTSGTPSDTTFKIVQNYTETLHSITVQNDGHGTVSRNNSAVSSTSIGNVTPVTLKANNNVGYAFKQWEITPSGASHATKVKLNNESNARTLTSGSTLTILAATAPAESSFRFNGTATVKAVFEPVAISLGVTFASEDYNSANDVKITNASGVQIQTATINTTYYIQVTLADGYEVADITGASSATLPIPVQVSTNVYRYPYSLDDDEDIAAVVTLRAVQPVINDVHIKDNTDFANYKIYTNSTYTGSQIVTHYYKQPDEVWAETNLEVSNLTIVYSNASDSESKTGDAEVPAVSLDPNLTVSKPTTEGGYREYTLNITATNAPDGVEARTATKTFTVRVAFNQAQQYFFRLEKLHGRCVDEENYQSEDKYYRSDAPLGAYVSAYNTARGILAGGNSSYPDYNVSDATIAEGQYNAFYNAYSNLSDYTKRTTVYVLTKYENTTSNPLYLHVENNNVNNGRDFSHFRMFCEENEDYVSSDTYKLDDFVAKVTRDNVTRYLYKITFTGHINFFVYRGSDVSNKLTGKVTTMTEYGDFYIDVFDQDSSSGASTTSFTNYQDFGHVKTVRKPWLEIGATVNAAQLREVLGVSPSGSVVSRSGSAVPGIDNINDASANTTLTIYGPIGNPNVAPTTTNMLATNETTFTASAQGKYRVTYTTKFGRELNANNVEQDLTRTVPNLYLWVAFNEIDIFVDMNSNVGNPIANFRYYTDQYGNPVYEGTSNAQVAYLPFEMELVTGSESVYQTTVKLDKLRGDYKIAVHKENGEDVNDDLEISYFTFEDKYITTAGVSSDPPDDDDTNVFTISDDARITGASWYKADSTSMQNLNTISFGTVINDFFAAVEGVGDNATVLTSAMDSVHGTGIVYDENDEIYHAKYAGLFQVERDGEEELLYNFNYVQQIAAKQEVAMGGNTYYFDKWVSYPTPVEGNVVGENNAITLDTDRTEIADSTTDLNFTRAPAFEEGDMTYVALYKLASAETAPTRVEITYQFADYNTEDGNYVFNPARTADDSAYAKSVMATYTKTVYVTNYSVSQITQSVADEIARTNMPHVESVFFDYSYEVNSAILNYELSPTIIAENTANHKVAVCARLTETPHTYTIYVNNNGSYSEPYTGYYQNSVTLTAPDGFSNPVWKTSDSDDAQVLGVGATYQARFTQTGYGSYSGNDCQVIYLCSDDSVESTEHTSVINNAITTFYTEGGTDKLRHNFFIYDYCDSDELIGGGVLYATVDSEGNYRQANAGEHLGDSQNRHDFIEEILNEEYNIEFPMQTIQNTGFRYKPYNPKENVYNYSDIYQAFLTTFEAENVNTPNYEGQRLRVFSFMIYNNQGQYKIVTSDSYAEVQRYIPQTNS